jgi:hypothetical protein
MIAVSYPHAKCASASSEKTDTPSVSIAIADAAFFSGGKHNVHATLHGTRFTVE